MTPATFSVLSALKLSPTFGVLFFSGTSTDSEKNCDSCKRGQGEGGEGEAECGWGERQGGEELSPAALPFQTPRPASKPHGKRGIFPLDDPASAIHCSLSWLPFSSLLGMNHTWNPHPWTMLSTLVMLPPPISPLMCNLGKLLPATSCSEGGLLVPSSISPPCNPPSAQCIMVCPRHGLCELLGYCCLLQLWHDEAFGNLTVPRPPQLPSVGCAATDSLGMLLSLAKIGPQCGLMCCICQSFGLVCTNACLSCVDCCS